MTYIKKTPKLHWFAIHQNMRNVEGPRLVRTPSWTLCALTAFGPDSVSDISRLSGILAVCNLCTSALYCHPVSSKTERSIDHFLRRGGGETELRANLSHCDELHQIPLAGSSGEILSPVRIIPVYSFRSFYCQGGMKWVQGGEVWRIRLPKRGATMRVVRHQSCYTEERYPLGHWDRCSAFCGCQERLMVRWCSSTALSAAKVAPALKKNDLLWGGFGVIHLAV